MLTTTRACLVAATSVVTALSGVTAATGADTAPRPVPARASGATLTPCTDLPSLPTAQCGSITVPLDRADPAAGTTTVGFAVVPRRDRTRPALSTIAVNPGGPGASAVDLSGESFATALQPIMDRRDLLLVDPRGVGRSEQLHCAALDDPAVYFSPLDRQRAAIAACGQELGGSARHYGSAAVADDIDDVRASLGIPQLDLLGVSYGTFLMPTYAQRHPTRVRSIVLSGAYAVNIDPSEQIAAAALRRAVRLVCERSRECDGAVVLRDLAALATQLRKHPVMTEVPYGGTSYSVSVDEWQLAGAVGKLYAGPADTPSKLGLARAAAAARQGDLAPVVTIVRDHLVKQASAFTLGPALVSNAMTWAVTCHDYPHDFELGEDVDERRRDYAQHVGSLSGRRFRPFSPEAWVTRDTFDSGACVGWPTDPTARPPFAPGTALPDVPVLVLSGDLDAITPSRSGRQAAAQFPNATSVEVADAGHTPAQTPEGRRLMLDFFAGRTDLARPSSRPGSVRGDADVRGR